ncbi:MAG: hypothetical protein KKD35_05105 [Elusimicrobia bacterium]|nr:hypothetical protein [Elusimicrobiota bacterium]
MQDRIKTNAGYNTIKEMKKRKVPKTIRQKKASFGMVANGGSQAKVLRDAGYSKAYADQPSKFKKTKE